MAETPQDETDKLQRMKSPRSTDMAESLASLRRGLKDIEAGRVVSARAVIQELRDQRPKQFSEKRDC